MVSDSLHGPLRFGIMTAAGQLRAWQMRCVRETITGGGALPVVVLDEQPSAAGGEPARVADRPRSAWDLYVVRVLHRSPHLRREDLTGDLAVLPRMDVCMDADPQPTQRAALAAHDLDFILRFSTGPIPSWVADAPPHGVWMFSHGELFDLSGRASGVEAVMRRELTNPVRLVRILDDGRRAQTLHAGTFRTVPHSHVATIDGICDGIADWAARACRVVTSSHARGHGDVVEIAPAQPPGNREAARLVGCLLRRGAVRVLRGLTRHEQWNIGLVDAPIDSFLRGDDPPPRWLPVAGTHYVADPFGMHDGELVIMAEQYGYLDRTGRIVALSASRESGVAAHDRPTVLPVDGHASYPFLFEEGGRRYCIPENNCAEAVQLFRSEGFPDRWVHVADLISGVRAVDPTILHYQGRWWLWCTDELRGMDTNLYVFHAKDLLGPWEAHVANPVISAVRSARPGGTPFVHGGRLFRPAQDCARKYGSAITINEVIELTSQVYEERAVARVEPDPDGPFPEGLHTLSAVGRQTLIDGRRDVMLPLALAGRVLRMARPVIGRHTFRRDSRDAKLMDPG